jgi:predicted nucleotidyltransferase
MTGIALDAAELNQVRAILTAHLGPQASIGVFGSRAGGTTKPWSDLDLVIDAGAPLPLGTMAALREAFDEAPLRWKVDLVDRHMVSEDFGALIDQTAVPLSR